MKSFFWFLFLNRKVPTSSLKKNQQLRTSESILTQGMTFDSFELNMILLWILRQRWTNSDLARSTAMSEREAGAFLAEGLNLLS